MPVVQAAVPADIREKLKKKLDKALAEDVSVDPAMRVGITSWNGTAPQATTRWVEDQFCLVILTKKEAKRIGLSPCNNDWDLCIWDPVTGRIVCTDTPE